MASLDNPITPQNIVDRFADYVVATGNSNIAWGYNAYPFAEFDGNYFGGYTSGKGIGINGGSVGVTGSLVTASSIVNALVNETYAYTNIRNLRALLFVDGGGGNTGSRPTPGYVYDATAIAYLNGNYLQGFGWSTMGVDAGQNVSAGNLESFFSHLRDILNNARAQTVTVQINVCHASCHSNCHGSRGRR
jgi:hypothetical protein